mgnify:CR=1 FL=1
MKIPIDILQFVPLFSSLYKAWIGSLRFDDQNEYRQIRELSAAGKPTVLCLWHEELFALTGYGYKEQTKAVTVVSQSKDGEIIARILERLGYATARGSSSRGGVRAMLQAKRIMEREKRVAVFTVDGPRGPRQQPKDGPIFLAHRADAYIVPIRALPARMKIFDRSWDHFQLPWPFCRCRIRVGKPYKIEQDTLSADVLAKERERLRLALSDLGFEKSF